MLTSNKYNEKNNLVQVIISISLSLCILILIVKFALAFKPFYYFQIDVLNIERFSGIDKADIIKNYDYVIDYLLSKADNVFDLPTLPSSLFGQVHFKEVKDIFNALDIVLLVSVIITVLGVIFQCKTRNLYFIKQTSNILIFGPVILGIIFSINFDKSFVIFHKIFFKNDYWIFDPLKDPIINILPQQFFFNMAILILIINLSIALFLRILYNGKLKYLGDNTYKKYNE